MATQQEIVGELDRLQALIARTPDGLRLDQIANQSALPLDRRTLQRRLKALVNSCRIGTSGKGSGTRYRALGAPEPDGPSPQFALFLAISARASKVQAYVRQPVADRKIVGYDRDFLDRYRPNVTNYLSMAEMNHLREIGAPNISAQPAGTYAKNILNRLLIDLSWNSSRLEGNTYSLLDTKRLVDFGLEAAGKDRREAQMILNHKEAIEFLVRSADEITFNRMTLLNLHALLADGLLENPGSPGRLREILVGIDGSPYHPPGVPQLISECFDQLLATATTISNPFEQAFFVMVQMPYLQPFDDVNKRVSRLAANIPLIKNNLCPLSFVDVPKELYTESILGVYELNDVVLLKDVFVWAYERSASRYAAVRQQIGEPDPFRLRHRAALSEVVGSVIRDAMKRKAAFGHIAAWSETHIDASDRGQFREMVEAELMALHEGNFARYRVQPGQFATWTEVWKMDHPG
jgi:hypothetical protein